MNAEPRKPGRPRQQAHEKADQVQGLASAPTRDPNAGVRPKRVLMGRGMNLDVSEVELDQKNFRYYWFADDPKRPGRIERAKGAYWEQVTNSAGQIISRPSGATTLFLMRLPMQYALEDMELKRQNNRFIMAKEAQIGANEYAPDDKGRAEGGNTAIRRSTSDNPYS